MSYRIEVKKKTKQWYWILKSSNGKILATSETYSSKAKAMNTVINLSEKFIEGSLFIWDCSSSKSKCLN